MSQDAGREKVFQTTKVRTSIKSDLSWIQKMKEAENIKDSRDPPEERTPTLSRQLSYVLMTAKKFEPATSPEKEVQIGKHSVSSEPTAANYVDLKSNDSAEVSRVDVKEKSEETKLERVIVNDPTAVEGSVSSPKSSPQENGNDLSKENAFDNLYNSLVEPINPIHLDAVEAQKTPDIPAVIDEPQDDTATNTNQSTKECGTVNVDVHVQNDEEAVKSEEKEKERPKEQDVSTTFTEMPEDSLETTETQSTSAKLAIEECETTNGEVTEQKTSDLNDVPSDAPLAGSQPQSQDPPSINGDTSMIVDDADAQDNVNPSHTEEALSRTKEAIVEEISTGQESKSVEVVVVALPTSTEEESTIKAGDVVSETATAVVDPDKSDEADLMLENEMVDAKSAAEGVVSESIETKSQTDTNNGSMIGKHSEPASSEPTAANDVDLKSNDSPEVSRVDVKENSEEAKLETVIVNDPTAVERSVANMVPDIIAESVSSPKSSPPENGNDLSKENAFDNLYNSLVEPINPIHLDAVETQKIPDIPAVIDEPQDDTATNTNQSTKECGTVMIETVDVTPKDIVVSLDKVDVQTPIETPEVIQENVEIAVQSAGDDQPAMVDINPEEIFKAEPVVVMPSTCEAEESGPLEKEVTEENISEEATEIEPIPLVPSVAGENQAVFDLSNALEIVPTSESNEEVGKMEITRANDEATDVKTVKESEEPANNNGSSPRSTETSPKSFIMRDGQEVCSHCDQFIGPVKLTVEYPPMYLHPECLTCGKCTQNLGNLLIPMFEHNHLIYCSDCYDVVYTL
ncbi:unnamed protein product [Knipowitschia caucasica]